MKSNLEKNKNILLESETVVLYVVDQEDTCADLAYAVSVLETKL